MRRSNSNHINGSAESKFRPVSAPAVLNSNNSPMSPSKHVGESPVKSEEVEPILVYDGLLNYSDSLHAHVAIYHHIFCRCFETIVFRQRRQRHVWQRFYMKEETIFRQMTPLKLKNMMKKKIQERLQPNSSDGSPTKFSNRQAQILSRYCLVQEFVQSRLSDIVNYEISRMFLSQQSFSQQLLTDPFGRPVQGRDYSPFITKLLVAKPDHLKPFDLEQDTTPPMQKFLQLVNISNPVTDFDQFSVTSSRYRAPGTQMSETGKPLQHCSSSQQSLSPSLHPRPASSPMYTHPPLRRLSSSSLISCLSATSAANEEQVTVPHLHTTISATANLESPQHIHHRRPSEFKDDNDDNQSYGLHSQTYLLPHQQDELSISKFAANSVLSEYDAIPPHSQDPDDDEGDILVEAAGITVQPSIHLLSSPVLEPRPQLLGNSSSSSSIAHLVPQELTLDYDFLRLKWKQVQEKTALLEPIFQHNLRPNHFRGSSASGSSATSPPLGYKYLGGGSNDGGDNCHIYRGEKAAANSSSPGMKQSRSSAPFLSPISMVFESSNHNHNIDNHKSPSKTSPTDSRQYKSRNQTREQSPGVKSSRYSALPLLPQSPPVAPPSPFSPAMLITAKQASVRVTTSPPSPSSPLSSSKMRQRIASSPSRQSTR